MHFLAVWDGCPVCWPIDKLGTFEGTYYANDVTCPECLSMIKKRMAHSETIEEVPEYEISMLGVVSAKKSGIVLKPRVTERGSVQVKLYDRKTHTHISRSINGLLFNTFEKE